MATLDGEAVAALGHAARLAGDPGLAPRLEQLVAAYVRDRQAAGTAPKVGELHQRLRARARAADGLRTLLDDPWERRAVVEAQGLIAPDLDALDVALGDLARRARLAAAEHDPDGRASADRRPGSPRWRFGWALATMWAEAGNYVGTGAASRFHGFAAEAFNAAGEEPLERLLRELAERWRAENGTARGEITPLPSFSPGQ